MNIKVPNDVIIVMDILHKEGYEAYIVGGCVRDSILGREAHDWDICTNAKPCVIEHIFTLRGFRLINMNGIEYGTVTVSKGEKSYEITTYRIDKKYIDNRFPEVEFTNDLFEDLSRRDFTINAMAYDYDKKCLIDLFNGQSDIENKIIRAVGNPKDRYKEDALRMMRAIRFSAQLGFEVDDLDKHYIMIQCNDLKNISAERKRSELEKILMSDASKLFKMYVYEVIKVILPEVAELDDVEQDNPYHIYNVYEHSVKVTTFIEPEIHLKLAALLHDLGKKETKTTEDGVDHFYGHAKESVRIAEDILKRFNYDNETINKVLLLIKYHSRNVQTSKKAVKKFMNQIGKDLFFDWCKLRIADIKAQSREFMTTRIVNIQVLEQLGRDVIENKEPFSRKDLKINGTDLITLGYEPGKIIGETLDFLLEFVLTNPDYNEPILLKNIAKAKLNQRRDNNERNN